MSTQVPWPLSVYNCSPLAIRCDSVIVDDCCLSIVSNDGSECSVNENMILMETEDASVTESSNVPTLNSGSSGIQSVTWSDFVVSMDNHGSIGYKRMSSSVALLKVWLEFPILRFQ